MKHLKHGEIFRRKGAWFRVTHEHDDTQEAPQENSDGHGPVEFLRSNYESEEELKAKGYWLIKRERGETVVYDAAEALRIAKRDGWGPGKSDAAKRRAVKRDFDFIAGWYNDSWSYIGVCVERLIGKMKGEHTSLWGIESNTGRYLSEVARELADELI